MPKWWGDIRDIIKNIITALITPIIVLGIPLMIGWLAWLKDLPAYLICLVILGALGFSLFLINQYAILKNRTKRNIKNRSDKKIETIIREWIDVPGYSVTRCTPDSNLKFHFRIQDMQNRHVNIIRGTNNPAIIQFVGRVKIISENQTIDELTLNEIASKIKIEMARLGISYIFDGSPNLLEYIRIITEVIIDDSLTEFYFRENISLIVRAIILIIEIKNQVLENHGS